MKGQYVRHPNDEQNLDWGAGIVTENSKGNEVSVFFEKKQEKKTILTEYVDLQLVEDPGKAKNYLDCAVYEQESPIHYKIILDKFLDEFPGGLHGEMYLKYEREDKINASKLFKELLSKERFSELLANNDFDALAATIKKVYKLKKDFDLLASFEMIKLTDALKKDENVKLISENLFDLLFGESDVGQRLYRVSENLKIFELNKWPILTFPLFMMYPDKYMFVKPNMTKAAAQKRGFDIQYDSQINPATYKRVLLFSDDLANLLDTDGRDELKPRDMIDIQGFMWCSYGEGWSKEGIEKAKAEFN